MDYKLSVTPIKNLIQGIYKIGTDVICQSLINSTKERCSASHVFCQVSFQLAGMQSAPDAYEELKVKYLNPCRRNVFLKHPRYHISTKLRSLSPKELYD